MTSLEAIALMRSEEQVADFHWTAEPKPQRRPRLVTAKPTGRPPSCTCGECRKCRNREDMRASRAALRASCPPPPPRPHGWRMSEVPCSVCRENRIAFKSRTGICTECQRNRARSIGKTAVKRGHFSHGGGI